MELVSEWFPGGKSWKIDTTFWADYAYEKYIVSDVSPMGDALQKAEH